ncbi:MAG: flagellar biosynthesis protein FlgF [Gammaproteobacteria bacterium]|nr:MAG: flagellar biosynthesis protein FlgF [Gammaproteobacteria bacterium]
MDKLLYIAMTGARETTFAQATSAHNLANASTTGFKADLAQFRAMPAYGNGLPSRVFAMSERPGFRLDSGNVITTGNDLDIAIRGEGWLVVQGKDGEELLSRRGDLKVGANGNLTNGLNQPIMGAGGPITIPPYEKLDIATDGTISIRPVGAQPSETAIIDRIKLVNPESSSLSKNKQGLFTSSETDVFESDINVKIHTRMLESSNVSVVEELTKMIQLSRQFEVQVKLMSGVQERGHALDQLLQP